MGYFISNDFVVGIIYICCGNMNLGAITKPLVEKMGALTGILQETLDTLKETKESNNRIIDNLKLIVISNDLIIEKLEVLNETLSKQNNKDK